MKPWNVLVTSLLGQEKNVLRELRQTGDFRRTDFKDVFLGWTDDTEAFLSAVLANTFPPPAITALLCVAEELVEFAARKKPYISTLPELIISIDQIRVTPWKSATSS